MPGFSFVTDAKVARAAGGLAQDLDEALALASLTLLIFDHGDDLAGSDDPVTAAVFAQLGLLLEAGDPQAQPFVMGLGSLAGPLRCLEIAGVATDEK